MSSLSLVQATLELTQDDLALMVLDRHELPAAFQDYEFAREGVLDNETMARHGFPNSTAARFEGVGRIDGYLREFTPSAEEPGFDGLDSVVAVVAHLFRDPEAVSRWMHEVFVNDFESNVGEELGYDHELVSVDRLEPIGFFDEALGLRTVQASSSGLMSSTIVDFRVGRVLGVAVVATIGDHERLHLTTDLALALERRIVRVALTAA